MSGFVKEFEALVRQHGVSVFCVGEMERGCEPQLQQLVLQIKQELLRSFLVKHSTLAY